MGERIAVLGAGSWGTALAHHLSRAGHDVKLWARDEEVIKHIKEQGSNPRYLKTHKLSPTIVPTANLSDLKGLEIFVFAVPSTAFREVATEVRPFVPRNSLLISTAKGLEEQSLKPMSEVLHEVMGAIPHVAVLSGPSFAKEVVEGKPTAVTMAGFKEEIAAEAAKLFHFDNFRVYTSTDLIGVEFGGVLKNVIALACGVVDGVDMGANARAALITRGLTEMQRLVIALGGEPMTVAGLSGLGDLLLTATGDLSRNRQVGLRLGKGEKLDSILSSLGEVAEGVKSTHKVIELANRVRITLPITEQVDKLLRGESTPQQAVMALLARSAGSEIKAN